MRTQTWTRWVVAAGAASLLATGCSKSDDGGAKGEDGEKDRVTINELLGGPDYASMDPEAQQLEIEEATAACMKEQGWEYIPVTYPDSYTEFSDEDYLEQLKSQGNGNVYWTLYPNGNGEEGDLPTDEFVDPNTEYRESLSEEERIAYEGSLWGTPEEQEAAYTIEIDPETGDEMWTSTGEQPGCQGKAYAEVYGEDPTQNPEIQETLMGYYEELQARVEADPRVVEANEKWGKCMKDAGFDYANQMEYWEKSYEDTQAKIDAIVGEDYNTNEWDNWTDAEWTEYYETHTEEEIEAMFAPKEPSFTAEQKSQLEALLADDIELAVAEYTCSKDLNDKTQDIYGEIEEQYALEHEDELKELAASVAGKE